MQLASENNPTSDRLDMESLYGSNLLSFITEALLGDSDLVIGDETLQGGGLDDQPFRQCHPALSEWSNPAYRSHAWVTERIIWHSLHHPDSIRDFIQRTASLYNIDVDNIDSVSRLKQENPTILSRCTINPTPRMLEKSSPPHCNQATI